MSEANPDALAAAYEECGRIVTREARNFAYAFRLLDRDRRRAIAAAYAFSRRLDDIADGSGSVERKREALAKARAEAAAALAGNGAALPTDPVLLALRDTAQRFGIPASYFDEHAAGVARDCDDDDYETFEDLYEYCYGVAGVVGLISVEIFGHEGGVHDREHAVALGLAMQLTNIIRDVGEDYARGRIYLPLEDRRRFGVVPEDLGRDEPTHAVKRLLAFETDRARRYYRKGLRLLPALARRPRACPAALAAIYSRLLDRIEESGFDVLRRRQSLPGSEKALLALRVLAGTWLA